MKIGAAKRGLWRKKRLDVQQMDIKRAWLGAGRSWLGFLADLSERSSA